MEYYNNEDFINYQNAFRKGYNYVLYGSEEENRKTPTVNFNDLESTGYYNGFQYGEYCEITSQTMSISDTQLIAIIDKSFSPLKFTSHYRLFSESCQQNFQNF